MHTSLHSAQLSHSTDRVVFFASYSLVLELTLSRLRGSLTGRLTKLLCSHYAAEHRLYRL